MTDKSKCLMQERPLKNSFFASMLKFKRTKILYHVLLVLLVVTIGPLAFFGWRMIRYNQAILETSERVSQTNIAASLAREIAQYFTSYQEQIRGLATAVELRGGIAGMERTSTVLLEKKLEELVSRSRNLLYISVVNNEGRGVRAGRYNGDDIFIQRYLTDAFLQASRKQSYISNPLPIQMEDQIHPVIVMSAPIESKRQWVGVTTVILSLEEVLRWASDNSTRGKTVYVVDFNGRIVVHPSQQTIVAGMDYGHVPIVKEFVDEWRKSKGSFRLPVTQSFELDDEGQVKQMLGTYCAILDPAWGVIVQVDQAVAFASVTHMKWETIKWGVLMLLVALFVGSVSARSITTPIRDLAEGTRLIAKGDFSTKIRIKSHTEIRELAETFNKMTDDLELYIQQIRRAGEENRSLFLGTIRALAAAIDEKDPYTRGHSERVTHYSLVIAKTMGLDEIKLETIRIAALLHDVGKIGIDDRVLKKPGFLTPEEFEVMKQHTVKGANIMKSIGQMKKMIPGLRHHHEQWDGNGYPDRLKADEIPLIARIISVADTFDAMTTNRPYQQALNLDFTLQKIKDNAEVKFDPEVVSALVTAIENGNLVLNPTPDRALAI